MRLSSHASRSSSNQDDGPHFMPERIKSVGPVHRQLECQSVALWSMSMPTPTKAPSISMRVRSVLRIGHDGSLALGA
jgi:hypothetical protein